MANLLVAATALGQNCTLSETTKTLFFLTNLFVSFGLSVVGTNLLCHRYLLEKARVMTKIYGTLALTPSVKYLEMLEGSLMWEARSLCIVAVGATAFVFYKPVGLVVGGLCMILTIVMVRRHISCFSPFTLLSRLFGPCIGSLYRMRAEGGGNEE
jgi:hypothetical protein